jgi:hypothetical protein
MMLLGCATPYSSTGFLGGCSDVQLAPGVFRITFQGNGYTAPERTQDFALLRAADLTLKHGYRYFAILTADSGGRSAAITLPGHAYTTANFTAYGNTAFGTANTTYTPATTIPVFYPNTGLLIGCFREKPQSAYVLDAQFLSNSLRTKYHVKA